MNKSLVSGVSMNAQYQLLYLLRVMVFIKTNPTHASSTAVFFFHNFFTCKVMGGGMDITSTRPQGGFLL